MSKSIATRTDLDNAREAVLAAMDRCWYARADVVSEWTVLPVSDPGPAARMAKAPPDPAALDAEEAELFPAKRKPRPGARS